MSCHVFPGHRAWPSLQSLQFDATERRLKRCLVAASNTGSSGTRLELSNVVFLEDAQRWSQAPLSLELQFSGGGGGGGGGIGDNQQQPYQDQAVCCPDGGILVQRRGAGFCHLVLLTDQQRVKWQRRWDFDLGQMDVEFESQLVYLPHYAKGVVHALTYPAMQSSSQLVLCHQRLVTAERVVAKSRYVGVDGFVVDNSGATVPGLAVFDLADHQGELLCAAALPAGLRKGWTFTVTNDGHVMLAECQVERDTNRFRLFGYTRNGDLDFTVKLLAALHQPWRLQLVRDNLGRDFVQEEDSDSRLLVPVEAYLRKERLDSQRLASARELAVATGFPQSI